MTQRDLPTQLKRRLIRGENSITNQLHEIVVLHNTTQRWMRSGRNIIDEGTRGAIECCRHGMIGTLLPKDRHGMIGMVLPTQNGMIGISVTKNANIKVEVTHAKQRQRRRKGASLDDRDRRVDLERLGNCDATLWADAVPRQTVKVGAE